MISYDSNLHFCLFHTGAIGMVIGHEITHGFDDSGMQFDKEGNSVNWWAEDTFKKFKERAQCIIDQYSRFNNSETGLNVNGAATQGGKPV